MWFKPKKSPLIGQQKEQQAQIWLTAQGLQILECNYRCKGGEIDLIALTPNHPHQESTLIFFEIKYRKNNLFGHPGEWVTIQKQQRILLCAQHYLLKHKSLNHLPMRFDVITFEGHQTTPTWIKNAFGQ